MSFYDTAFINIAHDTTSNSIIGAWKTPPSSAEFRDGMVKLIDAMKHFGTGKLVTDTTHLGAISEEDQKYSVTEWTEKAVAVGYRAIAIILPSDVFVEMSVKDVMDQVSGFPFQYFGDVASAKKWIATV